MRTSLIVAPALAVTVGAFAFWHSGARADSLCFSERFVNADSLSWWPPGARCTYGLPPRTDTLINPWFLVTLIVLGLVMAFATTVRGKPAEPGQT